MCENSVGDCVHQMNKYLPHAYILKRTKSNKEQERDMLVENKVRKCLKMRK